MIIGVQQTRKIRKEYTGVLNGSRLMKLATAKSIGNFKDLIYGLSLRNYLFLQEPGS
jgi:hypothetical protein